MNDRQLRAFIAVGKTGSMSKAAAQMYVSVPALKKQMDTLERELGIELFFRTNQGVILNSVGVEFLAYAEHVISEMDEEIERLRKMQNDESMIIRVGTDNAKVMDAIFYYAVAAFRQQKQDVKITMHRVSGFDGKKNDIFFGANYGEAEDVMMHYLCNLPITCLVSKNHRLSGRAYITADDLKSESLLLPPQEMLEIGAPALLTLWDNVEYAQLSHHNSEYRRRAILENDIGVVIGFEEHVNDNLVQLPLKEYHFIYRFYSVGADKKPCLRQFIEFLKDFYPRKCAELCAQLSLNA